MKTIIVSRHAATIQFLKEYCFNEGWIMDYDPEIIDGNATPDDVKGCRVIGNLPLHLAVLTAEYYAVEFPVNCPRGEELDLDYLDRYVKVVRYNVSYPSENGPHGIERSMLQVIRDLRIKIDRLEKEIYRLKNKYEPSAYVSTKDDGIADRF